MDSAPIVLAAIHNSNAACTSRYLSDAAKAASGPHSHVERGTNILDAPTLNSGSLRCGCAAQCREHQVGIGALCDVVHNSAAHVGQNRRCAIEPEVLARDEVAIDEIVHFPAIGVEDAAHPFEVSICHPAIEQQCIGTNSHPTQPGPGRLVINADLTTLNIYPHAGTIVVVGVAGRQGDTARYGEAERYQQKLYERSYGHHLLTFNWCQG